MIGFQDSLNKLILIIYILSSEHSFSLIKILKTISIYVKYDDDDA